MLGAVLLRVGTVKASELGGLYKSMPWTTVFCIIGGMSISAFPLFSGFVTKSMILTAAAAEHHWLVWGVLLFASAGVLDHSGIKVPFFSFFYHDAGHRVKEAPLNMLLAMGITAFLCIGIGIWPEPLYAILPYPVDYAPYTSYHVITQLQLLMFAALAFCVLIRKGWYPPEIRSVNLDSDWLYRRLAPKVISGVGSVVVKLDQGIRATAMQWLRAFLQRVATLNSDSGLLARNTSIGSMVAWVVLFLALLLVLALFRQGV